MNTVKYQIQVTEPKTVGKTLAFVKVQMGPLWITCRLEKTAGKYFLNPPANFVENLQGRPRSGGGTHSGWINTAGLTAELTQEVKLKAMAELGLKEEPA